MSYQLIFHASPQQLPPAGTGTVAARSRTIPRLLENALAELSPDLYPGATVPGGQQFSYVQVECGSTVFHVLSSLFTDSAQGYTAHHLALTHDEVQALRRNASRPTPAGVILALSNIGLWCTTAAQQRFPYIDDEPRLTAAALPEAAMQPTWKRLTGHKNNARCFFTPPYDRNCVVTIPTEFSAVDTLLLIHESDWLSSTRGWGKTFTTLAGSGARQLKCHRIIFRVDCPLSVLPDETTPLLAITPDLELNYGSDSGVVTSVPAGIPTPHRADRTPIQAREKSVVLPCKYTETPDAEIYNVLPAPNKWLRRTCYLGGAALLWGGISLISGVIMEDAGELTGDIITHINTEEDALLLSRLAASTYSHESTSRHLSKFEARLRTLPATGENSSRDDLVECVRRLRSAPQLSSGHAYNLQRLAECAGTLGLNANDLCRLYMHEATFNKSAETWLPVEDTTELADWQKLLTAHPGMAEWLLQAPFAPFVEPLRAILSAPAPTQQPSDSNGAN